MATDPHIDEFFGVTNALIGEVLTYHLNLEGLLEQMLRKKLPDPSALNFDRMMFAEKASMACAFGLIGRPVYNAVRKLNNLRNKFAHNFGYSPTFEEIHALAKEAGAAGVEFTDGVDSDVEYAKSLNYTASDLLNATFRNVFFHIAYEQGEDFWHGIID